MISRKEAAIHEGVITLENGRVVPTFRGYDHSEDSKTKIKLSLLDKHNSKEQVERQSTVWNFVKPLFIRGGINIEIAEVTGLTYTQVLNAVRKNGRRSESNSVSREYFSLEKSRERLKRARSRPRLPERKALSEEKLRDIAIARSLFMGGFIAKDDISSWGAMVELYKEQDRPLTVSFSQRLRLEAFCLANKARSAGDDTLLHSYYEKIAQTYADPYHTELEVEEDFIFTRISLENYLLLREDGEGRKWRQFTPITAKGGLTVDTVGEFMKRDRSRQQIAEKARENKRKHDELAEKLGREQRMRHDSSRQRIWVKG